MATRKIVRIDEEKCNGCGLCVTGCAEGALAVVDGKARLLKESYCDGLGACLGECPQGAISIEEREADAFDGAAVEAHLSADHSAGQARAAAQGRPTPAPPAGGCPGARMMALGRRSPAPEQGDAEGDGSRSPSQLGHWPVQLALLPLEAPFYRDAELVLAADCAAYAVADFHRRFLAGRALAIACPKLDDVGPYVDKLAEILRRNPVRGLVLVHMEVPCCSGIVRLAEEAAARSGRSLPVRNITIGIRGDVLDDRLSVLGH